MPEYKQVLATRQRCLQFEAKLKEKATWINTQLSTKLPDDVVEDVVIRLVRTIAIWEHSPIRQRERQKKQVAKRRRGNRSSDLWIVRLHEDGLSQRRIAKEVGRSRNAVRNVLRRDLPRPSEQTESDTEYAG